MGVEVGQLSSCDLKLERSLVGYKSKRGRRINRDRKGEEDDLCFTKPNV